MYVGVGYAHDYVAVVIEEVIIAVYKVGGRGGTKCFS